MSEHSAHRPKPAIDHEERVADQVLTELEVKSMLHAQAQPVLSLHMPTHHGGDQRQDHITIKNLLHQAETIEPLLAPTLTADVRTVAASPAFWRHPAAGLAVFAGSNGVCYRWLAEPVAELVTVGRHYQLAQVHDLLVHPHRFFVLELTQRGAILLEGDRRGLHQVDLELQPPASEAGRSARGDHALGMRHSGSGSGSAYFGTASEPDAKAKALAWFHTLDHAICRHLHDTGAPLLTVGVEWLLPLYQQVSHYQLSQNPGIAHGTDHLDPAALHRLAHERLKTFFHAELLQQHDRHEILSSTTRVNSRLEEALAQANGGMVASAFTANDLRRWGTFDPVTGRIIEHEQRQTGDEDLLNTLFCLSAAGGAPTFAVAREQVPGEHACSVLLRY